MRLDDAPPAWVTWAGSTTLLVLALLATPSETDNGDICPRPAGWLVVHPADESQDLEDFDLARACNDAAPKRAIAAAAIALVGGAITVSSRRREQTAAEPQ